MRRAVNSGATQAGLAVGASIILPRCRIVGIDIDAEPERVRADVVTYAKAAADVGAVALPAVSRFAWAQAYPTRPVRLIEGFGAGSAPDIVARLIGQSLSEHLGNHL
jgi:hypothetical protein